MLWSISLKSRNDLYYEQGRKRPLDTSKRMIKRRGENEKESKKGRRRDIEREGEIIREIER